MFNNQLLLFCCPLLFGLVASAFGQGTVYFANSTLSKVTQIACNGHQQVIVDAEPGMIIGVFAGPTPNSLQLVLPVAVITTPGVFSGGTLTIPGSAGGQVVWMKIAGWEGAVGTNFARAINYGQTGVKEIMLGSAGGPGTIIWQASTGTREDRFKPFTTGALSACFPTWGVTALKGVVYEGSKTALFTFSCTEAPWNRQVSFTTVNDTAKAGLDFEGTNGTVVLLPGETRRDIAVRLIADEQRESNESFRLQLSDPHDSMLSGLSLLAVQSIAEPALTSVAVTPNGVDVEFDTFLGWQYQLESSVNLQTWTPVEPAMQILGPGLKVIRDTTLDCCGQRFYRLMVTALVD